MQKWGEFQYFPYIFVIFYAIIFKKRTAVDLIRIIQHALTEQNRVIKGWSIQEKVIFEGVSYLPRGWCIMIEPATQCFIWLIWHRFIISSGNVTSKYLNWNADSKESGQVLIGGHDPFYASRHFFMLFYVFIPSGTPCEWY